MLRCIKLTIRHTFLIIAMQMNSVHRNTIDFYSIERITLNITFCCPYRILTSFAFINKFFSAFLIAYTSLFFILPLNWSKYFAGSLIS